MDNKFLLFTYGTLKQGYPNDDYLAHADFLGDFEVDGCMLYDIGYAPALVPNFSVGPQTQKNKVKGELYLVAENHLTKIDRLEGHPNLYERMQLCWHNVTPGRQLCVLSYVWKGTTHGHTQIYEWTKKPSRTPLLSM